MAFVAGFAFIAGALTILSPCTLPVVPLVLGGTAGGHGRARLAGFVTGFAVTFVGTTVVLASALAAAGLTTATLRPASLAILVIAGLALVVPALRDRLERQASATVGQISGRIARPAATATGSEGPQTIRDRFSDLGLGLILGGSIALVWAPCVGPIMAAVIATAVASGPTATTAAIGLAYVAGALVPLLAIAAWGRRATRALGNPVRRLRVERGFGALMIAAALVVATGLDVPLGASVATVLPAGWSDALLAVESQPAVADRLPAVAGPLPAVADRRPTSDGAPALEDLGPAPELTGITAWLNSDPLTLASLRGKVVLVHFWTFACINCIHVQPDVKAWYERYADEGFVVIGVHTPELSFERDLGNVRTAVADDGVRFPVAFDPDFATWRAYGNHYWPAFYFVDRTGRIRHVHFGEGDYDGSEAVIRELLAEPA